MIIKIILPIITCFIAMLLPVFPDLIAMVLPILAGLAPIALLARPILAGHSILQSVTSLLRRAISESIAAWSIVA
jgi:hypothetical protein